MIKISDIPVLLSMLEWQKTVQCHQLFCPDPANIDPLYHDIGRFGLYFRKMTGRPAAIVPIEDRRVGIAHHRKHQIPPKDMVCAWRLGIQWWAVPTLREDSGMGLGNCLPASFDYDNGP